VAYTITNTFGVFETWVISGWSGNGWWGCEVTGAISGQTGIVWAFILAPASLGPTPVIIRKTSAGAFTASETMNITGGGSFQLAAAYTSTVTEGIMTLTGEDLTDSTANTNGATGIGVTFAVTNGAVFSEDDFIKIESEYMCVLSVAGNNLTCRRGELGTTAVSHATAIDVYIANKAGFQTLYDASVAGVWGFDSLVDGHLELDCTIQIGDPVQTARTIFITNDEAVVVLGDVGIMGASAYQSWFKSGIGHIDEDGFSRRGSSIQALGYLNGPIALGVIQYRWGVLEVSGGTIGPDIQLLTEHYIYRCSIGPKPPAENVVTGITGDGAGFGNVGTGIGFWKDVVLSGCPLNYATDRCNFERVLMGDAIYGLFFVAAGDIPVEVFNLVFNVDNTCFAFFEDGEKTFTNCVGYDSVTASGFLATSYYNEMYTVDRKFIAEDGSPLLGINNKAWNVLQDPNTDAPLFNVDSAADGTIAPQKIRVTRKVSAGASPGTIYTPITFIARREGWARDRFAWTLDEFVFWTTRMQNYRI